jgi:4-carboxymuconolactone decarboxylase
MFARIKEICILSIASFWQSDFEWHWHEKAARAKQITPEQIEAIRTQQDPGFIDAKEGAAYRLVRALIVDKEIPDGLYEETMDVLGLSETLDLIGLRSLYSMIAHTIMLFKLRAPE